MGCTYNTSGSFWYCWLCYLRRCRTSLRYAYSSCRVPAFLTIYTVDYLLVKHANRAAAIPILLFYFILFILLAVSFFRLVYITTFEPPYVPLGPAAIRDKIRETGKRKSKETQMETGIGSGEYNSGQQSSDSQIAAMDIDVPGLEQFYTRDVFVCEMDGKPKWCSTCGNWKPDRAHHCSSSGRCISKMDHFCPWVGGPIGENNFKFFVQFTGWTALFCLHIIVVLAFYMRRQHTLEVSKYHNRHNAMILQVTHSLLL